MSTKPDSTDEADDLDDGWNVDEDVAPSLPLTSSFAPGSSGSSSVPPASAAEDTEELDAGWETDSELEQMPGALEAKKRWPRRERRRKDPAPNDRSPVRVVKPAPSQEPSLKKARRDLDRKRRDQEATARAEREAARKAERDKERKARPEARPAAPKPERRVRTERNEPSVEHSEKRAKRSETTAARGETKPARSRRRRAVARPSTPDRADPRSRAGAKRWIGGALTLLAVASIGLLAWRLSR